MDAAKFIQLMWKYRTELERFVDWAAERRRAQRALGRVALRRGNAK